MQKTSAFGKNNFDRLEAAGLVASAEDETVSQKIKAEARIAGLVDLDAKLGRITASAEKLYVQAKPQQLKTLSVAIEAASRIMKDGMPTGAKKHLTAFVNELTSLREGVFLGTATDKKTLALIACKDARVEIQALKAATEARMTRIMAGSSNNQDLEEFYKQAEDVINKHSAESTKLDAIAKKPFILARVPVVPTGEFINIEKLVQQGFKTDNLGGYAVLHNQLVIGINSAHLGVANTGKRDASRTAILEEADALRRKMQKAKGEKLLFVSETPFKYKTGSWFWVMSERDLNMLAKAFPGGKAKITRWGFAFN